MKRFYALLLPALFLTSASLAQNNFKPGYVVNAVGDTLRGNIDHREWGHNPKTIRFQDGSGKVTEYSVNNAKGFGVNGLEQYRVISLPISMDDVAAEKLKTTYDTTQLVATTFLRALTKGEHLSLYSLTDDVKTRYIITEKNDSQPTELTYHLYLNRSNNAIMTVDGYRLQLTAYTEKYRGYEVPIITRIQKANYAEKDIIQIVNAINGASANTLIAKGNSGTRFYIGAAMVGATVSYTGYTDLAHNSKDHVNYFPQLNVGFDYIPNKEVRKFFIRGEVNISSANIKSISANATKSFDMFTATVNPQAIYNFYSPKKLNFYVGAGFAYHYSSYGKEELTFVGAPNYTMNEKYSRLESSWFSLPLKAGLVFNKVLEVELGYSPKPGANINSNGFSSYTGSLSSFQIGVNYLIKK